MPEIVETVTVKCRRAGFQPNTIDLELVEGQTYDDIPHIIANRHYWCPVHEIKIESVERVESIAAAVRARAEAPYTDEALHAAIANEETAGPGPARAAPHLLRLDTPARRLRAVQDAQTAMNLIGGRYSARVAESVTKLLEMIEAGREGDETYPERRSRELREIDEGNRRVERLAIAARYQR